MAANNTYALTAIMAKLVSIEGRMDRIEKDLGRVSKHVPFVDCLAESGVVKAVSSINSFVSSFSTTSRIDGDKKDATLADLDLD
jgi:hypothetical protein